MKTTMTKMQKNLGKWLFVPFLLASGPAVLSAPQAVVVAAATQEFVDANTMTLTYGDGMSLVSATQAGTLKSFVDSIPRSKHVEEIVVAAYSDQAYPSGKDQKLTKADRDLADQRGKNVKDELKKITKTSVKVFRMAEKSNWLEKTFNMKDAEVKQEAKTPNSSDKLSSKDRFYRSFGEYLKANGGPGKVVVTARFAASREYSQR